LALQSAVALPTVGSNVKELFPDKSGVRPRNTHT
jgi:hypothetical protein